MFTLTTFTPEPGTLIVFGSGMLGLAGLIRRKPNFYFINRRKSRRPHDLRHHAITKLAESQASEQTIMAIAGHVSQEMLEHYSHIRLEAKRKALASLDNVTFLAQLQKSPSRRGKRNLQSG